MAELHIYIKQKVTINPQTGQSGYYAGNNPQNLSFFQGLLPQGRQWDRYGQFQDITDYIGNPYKLKLSWSQQRDDNGNIIAEGGISSKRSASGTLEFENYAFDLLKKWLIDDVSAALNVVEVLIKDVGCGDYFGYQITSKDLVYCENANCTFAVTLKQLDEPLLCLQRTVINDNWQGWFQGNPSNGKKHPRFSYCNEVTPNMLLAALLTAYLVLCFFLVLFGFIFGTVYNIIAALINAVIAVLNFLGIGNNITPLPFFSYNNFLDALGIYATEMLGCGREHPAPLIRDYIKNVCDKCGIAINSETAPVFFSTVFNLQGSDRNRTYNEDNPHYNACYLTADRKKGIRRYQNINIFTGYTNRNTTDWYIPENAPNITLEKFLETIKLIYNFEWQIISVNNSGINTPTLFIQRKDWWISAANSYLFDFSAQGADRPELFEGICYEWNGKVSPAILKGIYQNDPSDNCGNEGLQYANDVVYFGDITNNPTLKGEKTVNTGIGAASFRLTGADNDYIYDALQSACSVAAFTSLGIFLALVKPIINSIVNNISDFGDYALLMQNDKCSLPKILIWDSGTIDNAKCIRTKYATSNNGAQPQINPAYNPLSETWDTLHPPDTFVIGSNLTPATSPRGVYKVADITTVLINIERPAMLVNYPMYLEHQFYDSIWDWYYYIEDPVKTTFLNMTFSLKMNLCCEYLQRLKLFNATFGAALGGKVKLNNQYNTDGYITEITASYDPEDTYGQWIEIKGKL